MGVPQRLEVIPGSKNWEIKTKINEVIDYLEAISHSENASQGSTSESSLANSKGFTVQHALSKFNPFGKETSSEAGEPQVGDTEPNGTSETTIRLYKADGWHVINKNELDGIKE